MLQPPSAARRQMAASLKHQQSFKGTNRIRQRGSTVLVASHREREGRDAQGSLFQRPNLSASDWPPELEKAFKRHVTAALLEYIKKKFAKNSLREVEEAPETTAVAVKEDTSLASALPTVLAHQDEEWLAAWMGVTPDTRDTPTPSEAVPNLTASAPPPRTLYVPPHMRARKPEHTSPAIGAAEAPAGSIVDAAPLESPAAPAPSQEASLLGATAPEQPAPSEAVKAPQKYVPPFLRRKAAAEAEGGAMADEGKASVGHGVATPSTTSTVSASASPPLPADASGGNDRFGFCVHQGPRPSMEDAIDALAQFDCGAMKMEFYAVYDGHGGTQAVEFVKKRLPPMIRGHSAAGDLGRLDEALRDSFLGMDEQLLEHLQQNQPQAQVPTSSYALSSGCVTCIAIVCGKVIRIANLGDCRALLCCGGEIKLLTEDHRPEVNEAERDRLEQLGVEVSSDGYLHGRIGVSRAFGDWAWNAHEKCKGIMCLPEVHEAEVGDDTEFLLLACDGIFEKMTTKEAGQIVRRSLRVAGDAKSAAETLIKHASKRNGTDNLSALVVLFKPPPKDEQRTAPRLFKRAVLAELAPDVPADAEAPPAAPRNAT